MKILIPNKISFTPDEPIKEFETQITECVKHLHPDESVVNLIKIDLGDAHLPWDIFSQLMSNIKNAFQAAGITNCLFIPIGNRVGIKDISIDYIKIVEDKNYNVESKASSN